MCSVSTVMSPTCSGSTSCTTTATECDAASRASIDMAVAPTRGEREGTARGFVKAKNRPPARAQRLLRTPVDGRPTKGTCDGSRQDGGVGGGGAVLAHPHRA